MDLYVTRLPKLRSHLHTNNGVQKTFYFFFTMNIFLAVFVWFFIPETKKVSLEEIDTLFGGANHVEKGADILHVEDAHHANLGPGYSSGEGQVDTIIVADSKRAEDGQV